MAVFTPRKEHARHAEPMQRGCENMLEPFYTLWRSIGPDFEDFLKCAGRIAGQMAEKKGDAD